MIKNIRHILVALALLILPVLWVSSGAAFADVADSACGGAHDLEISPNPTTKCASLGSQEGTINGIVAKVINLFSIVVGVVAVVMVIVAGFRYITSGGSSDKVGSAKSTLMYAIIGLVIVAMAQLIVRFVLNKAT